MIVCGACNASNDDQASSCRLCGRDPQQAPPPAAAMPPPPPPAPRVLRALRVQPLGLLGLAPRRVRGQA